MNESNDGASLTRVGATVNAPIKPKCQNVGIVNSGGGPRRAIGLRGRDRRHILPAAAEEPQVFDPLDGLPMNVFTLRMAVLLNVISIGLSSAPEKSKCRTGATGNGASYLGRCDPARRVIA